jgi:hypothetical protein
MSWTPIGHFAHASTDGRENISDAFSLGAAIDYFISTHFQFQFAQEHLQARATGHQHQ